MLDEMLDEIVSEMGSEIGSKRVIEYRKSDCNIRSKKRIIERK
jgi:hypothetical protein